MMSDQSEGGSRPCSLSVSVIRAADLRPKTLKGGTNPYAALQLGDSRLSTPVLHETLTPRWNSVLTFPLPPCHNKLTGSPHGADDKADDKADDEADKNAGDKPAVLTVTIMHQHSLVTMRAHKFLGEVKLQLDDIISTYNGKKMYFHLQSKLGKKFKHRGFVELSFSLVRDIEALAKPLQLPAQTKTASAIRPNAHAEASAQTRPPAHGDLSSSAVRPRAASAASPPLAIQTGTTAAQMQDDAHTATSGRAQPNTHRRRHPRARLQPTANHIIWEDAGLFPPASVQPGVGEREPTRPSCVENLGLGTSRPSAAPGLQPPAAKPGRRSPAPDSAPSHPASTESACENSAIVGDQADLRLLEHDCSGSCRSVDTPENTIGPLSSSASLSSVFRRLRRRRGGSFEAARAPDGAMFSSDRAAFYLPFDGYQKIGGDERPARIIARLFPCLGENNSGAGNTRHHV